MTLHDAIKTIKNRVFLFSLKKEQNLVSFQKTPKKTFFFEKKQNNRWVVFFLKKNGFFSTLILAHTESNMDTTFILFYSCLAN